ncbi:hypothetical protein [Stieleria neptunia]|uniref:hypothetical protein n=1 Tax=Stieleria neptunia TaxID=2527979 RepID=UPI00119C9785|nr:hypothetical protein [Stieleria neptunia]
MSKKSPILRGKDNLVDSVKVLGKGAWCTCLATATPVAGRKFLIAGGFGGDSGLAVAHTAWALSYLLHCP